VWIDNCKDMHGCGFEMMHEEHEKTAKKRRQPKKMHMTYIAQKMFVGAWL
jgi:hypothetical protein